MLQNLHACYNVSTCVLELLIVLQNHVKQACRKLEVLQVAVRTLVFCVVL